MLHIRFKSSYIFQMSSTYQNCWILCYLSRVIRFDSGAFFPHLFFSALSFSFSTNLFQLFLNDGLSLLVTWYWTYAVVTTHQSLYLIIFICDYVFSVAFFLYISNYSELDTQRMKKLNQVKTFFFLSFSVRLGFVKQKLHCSNNNNNDNNEREGEKWMEYVFIILRNEWNPFFFLVFFAEMSVLYYPWNEMPDELWTHLMFRIVT